MSPEKRTVTVLLAEDDDDDYLLIKTAFGDAAVSNALLRFRDGVELLDYLFKRGAYAGRADDGKSQIVLLDLNMPRMDGREALKQIKANAATRAVPVVVMTTSKADEDIVKSYEAGACSYIRKPVDFAEFVEACKVFKRYWLELVELPPGSRPPP